MEPIRCRLPARRQLPPFAERLEQRQTNTQTNGQTSTETHTDKYKDRRTHTLAAGFFLTELQYRVPPWSTHFTRAPEPNASAMHSFGLLAWAMRFGKL